MSLCWLLRSLKTGSPDNLLCSPSGFVARRRPDRGRLISIFYNITRCLIVTLSPSRTNRSDGGWSSWEDVSCLSESFKILEKRFVFLGCFFCFFCFLAGLKGLFFTTFEARTHFITFFSFIAAKHRIKREEKKQHV